MTNDESNEMTAGDCRLSPVFPKSAQLMRALPRYFGERNAIGRLMRCCVGTQKNWRDMHQRRCCQGVSVPFGLGMMGPLGAAPVTLQVRDGQSLGRGGHCLDLVLVPKDVFFLNLVIWVFFAFDEERLYNIRFCDSVAIVLASIRKSLADDSFRSLKASIAPG
ncbi:uncharacterized protein BCR38DRAFT_99702 [Pseudomassariella vexata]|uniref:Uncharacterized protein n=1 Tax=Pseudomassariella vexata TaxID=1141098 RepID=A0A1Y2EFB7_9PEZI|nr:uncharacterized protein BCR38DRAFT_99702 [Pseudomassariella vexata]ORY70097.1 hypothetical protein BCR38DRAFT_99702 [Pseudomassariella vexata]